MITLPKTVRNATGFLLRSGLLATIFATCQPASAQHGDLDPTFQTGAGANGTVTTILPLNSGKILIAGSFSSYDGIGRKGVAILNEDGSLDTSFHPGTGVIGTVLHAAEDFYGRILLVGNFSSYNGTTVGKIAMVKPDGSLDTTFRVGTGSNGPIQAVARSGDSWAIGGSFSSFNGELRQNFALLSDNGEPSYFRSPAVNGVVEAINGTYGGFGSRFMVTGRFDTVDSQDDLDGVAIIDEYGQLERFFRPRLFEGGVRKVGLAKAGAVIPASFGGEQYAFIAGEFTRIGDEPHAYLSIVGIDGEPDPFFSIYPNGAVLSIAVGENGDDALIAGRFTEVNGIPMRGVARLVKKSIYRSFSGYSDKWEIDPGFGGADGPDIAVRSVSEDAAGRCLISGDFTQVSGTPVSRFTRLLSEVGLSLPGVPPDLAAEALSGNAIRLTWGDSSNVKNYRLERSPDGASGWEQVSSFSTSHIVTGLLPETEYHFRVRAGNANGFSEFSDITAATTTAIWTGAGSPVPGTAGVSFTGGSLESMAVQPDGKILISGYYTTVLGAQRKYMARLNADRTLDASFDTGNLLTSSAKEIALAPDGRIYVVSNSFSSVLGWSEYGILRLNPDGTHDATFTPPKSRYQINCVEIDALGRVLLGLNTENFGGRPTGALVRLEQDGSIDPNLALYVDSSVNAVGFHPDQRIVAGGSFYEINDIVRRGIMRCDPLGVVDPALGNSTYVGSINALEALPDGSIVIAGSFTSVFGEPRSRLAKLNPDGSLDGSFIPPEISSTVSELERLPDGKFLIAGGFTTVAGKYMRGVARLEADGAIDRDFRIGVGASGTVRSISLTSDGSIIVAGSFNTFGSEKTSYLAFLQGEMPVLPPVSPVLAGAGVGIGHADLSWNGQEAAFGYFIESSANGTDGWTEVARLRRDSVFYRAGDLVPGETRFFRIRASNGFGASTFSDTVSTKAWTRFQAWNVEKGFAFDTAAGADDDGDGMGQLMEYGLGLDPEKSDSEGALSTQMIGGNLVLTYYESRPELIYKVEVSDDLSKWSTEGVSVFHGNFSMGWAPVVEPSRFLRLHVSEE